MPATPVEDATVRSQQARQERAEDTADTMDTGGAYRVVDMQLSIHELDGENQHDTADQADDDRAVNQIHRELGPFRHCTAHNRNRGGAEDRLKD